MTMIPTPLRLAAVVLAALVNVCAAGEDWPMYRGNAARTGYTANTLPAELNLAWRRDARHRPNLAWPSQHRLQFDATYHPVIADGRLFFGSSADNRIYALDAATGRQLWTFDTEGPVRIAPVVWEDCVLAGSDDGFFYCLEAATGELKWKLLAGPRDDRIIGNGRLISRWAVRGGPAVVDGVVYFGAGPWPTEGVYIYAVDIKTGKVLWKNDSSGSMLSNKPRAGTNVKSGPASQGHLAVGADVVAVPTGRGAIATFERADGKFRYFEHGVYPNKAGGGTKAALVGELVIYGENHPDPQSRRSTTRLCNVADGEVLNAGVGPAYADHPKMLIAASGDRLQGLAKVPRPFERKNRRGETERYKALPREALWAAKAPFPVLSVIVAADKLVLGGAGRIAVLDIKSKAVLLTLAVDGDVLSLAVANARLYAATRAGTLYCFAAGDAEPVIHRAAEAARLEIPGAKEAAEEILRITGVGEGYCLDIGCQLGQLTIELGCRSNLHIYGVGTNAENIQLARRMLEMHGLLGTRVTLLHVESLDKLPFTGRFADLVVSAKSLSGGPDAVNAKTVEAMLCPYLGVACLGKPGAMKVTRRRGVPGAGNWTHFYADAANTHCGSDTALHGPLELLWFDDTTFPIADRHSMSSPTMVYDGYMVCPGVNGVRVANVYNGRTIWEHEIKGLNYYPGGFSYERRMLSGNMCVADGKVFVRHHDRCWSFDIRNGKILGEWPIPAEAVADGSGDPLWGTIACADGILYGSAADPTVTVKGYPGPGTDVADRFADLLADPERPYNHHHPDSTALFALDAATGKLKWVYKAKHSIRNTSVAVAAGRVYLVDKPLCLADDYRYAGRNRREAEDKLTAKAAELARNHHTRPANELAKLRDPRGTLLALDAKTGKVVWTSADDVGFGSMLAVSVPHDLLLMGYVMGGSTVSAFRASTGKPLWSRGIGARPAIRGDTLVVDGAITNLLTGEPAGRISGIRKTVCAPPVVSARMILFRAGVVGYYDLTGARKTEYYGGIRPGCYVDMTPAGGLLVMADGAIGCTCSYLNQCAVALQPKGGK